MKYMIAMFGDQAGVQQKSAEWVERVIEFMVQIDKDLEASGELVFQAGLADAPTAKTVGVREGLPVTVRSRSRRSRWPASGSSTSPARSARSSSPATPPRPGSPTSGRRA